MVNGSGALGTVDAPANAVGATHTAPSTKPTPNPVCLKFSSTDLSTGLVAEAASSVRVVSGVHVNADFQATDYPICLGGTVSGTVGDHFDLDLKQSAATHWEGSNYKDDPGTCPAPWTVPVGYIASMTSVGACDWVHVNDASGDIDPMTGRIDVFISGITSSPACNAYISNNSGPPIRQSDNGGTSQETVIFSPDASFDLTIGSGLDFEPTKTLTLPVDPGLGSGQWTFTLTELP